MPGATEQPSPPVAVREPSTTVVHGVRRVDDYAWMHDPHEPRLLPYLAAERAYYDAAVASIGPLRETLFQEMQARTVPADSSVSWGRAGLVYYTRTVRGREFEQFCRIVPDPAGGEGRAEVLLDLNDLAGSSSYVDLGGCEPSPDGRLLAYSVDLQGDEVFELRVRDLATGADLPDAVARSYYGLAWSADSTTLFYVVHDEAYRPHQVWRHRVGTRAEDDALVLEEPDARFEVEVRGTRSGELVLIEVTSRDTSEVWWLPSTAPESPPRVVATRRPGVEYVVEHLPGGPGGDDLLVVTDLDATEFRLAGASLSEPATWHPRLPYDPAERLVRADAFAGHVVLSLRRGAGTALRILRRDGSAAPLDVLPSVPVGTVVLARNEDPRASSVLVLEESLVEPKSWWDVDLATGARTLRKRLEVPGYEPGRYRTERVEAAALDGTTVPVTLAYRDGTSLDGSAPCLLYGYGAYESCLWPEWDPVLPSLLDRGVVYAVAHVRGGGEGGRSWWLDGRLRRKRTTFTDFVAAADHLADGLVDPRRIVSRGLSAGGLLQGAVYSSAPARWRAVVAEVPFVDVVTTMLDPTIPLTVNEWDEWGDPRDPDDFAYLLSYSPYDNVPSAPRPDLLVTGALHDPRVMVREPAKWVARLRATDDGASTVLFRAELGESAHTGPSGRYDHLRYEAEIAAWVLTTMDLGT